MRLLGPAVLRIGGNTVDKSWWSSSGERPPSWAIDVVTPADFTVLRGLLDATGWSVLLGVNLGHFELGRIADEARNAKEILGAHLIGIEIGNEPNDFGVPGNKLRSLGYGVAEYLPEAESYSRALTAAAPGVRVYGPATSTEGADWLTQMGSAANMFTELTQHYYPIRGCTQAAPSTPQPTAVPLLSPAIRAEEDRILEVLTSAGRIAHRPVRIGETNSVACSGTIDASPTFAGALWALDWILRSASKGVRGLNFHGGVGGCGVNSESPICTPVGKSSQAGEVTAQPDYYGLLAASLLEGGRFAPTHLTPSSQSEDLNTWATVARGGTVTIAVDNLSSEGIARPLRISTAGYRVFTETLIAPSIVASTGIVLGGKSITNLGQWRSHMVRLASRHNSIQLTVRPSSAVIVILHRMRPRR